MEYKEKNNIDDILGSVSFCKNKIKKMENSLLGVYEECIDDTESYQSFIKDFVSKVSEIDEIVNLLMKKSIDIESYYNEIKLLKRKRQISIRNNGKRGKIETPYESAFEPDDIEEDDDDLPF